jgi:toxin ParE1/3/4
LTRPIIYSPLSDIDLAEIWEYIRGDNELAADRFIDEIEAHCDLLRDSPELGRDRSHDLQVGIRSFPFRNYSVFYRVESEVIEIVRILHGARDVPAEFKNE